MYNIVVMYALIGKYHVKLNSERLMKPLYYITIQICFQNVQLREPLFVSNNWLFPGTVTNLRT